jgi:hypothetical protein
MRPTSRVLAVPGSNTVIFSWPPKGKQLLFPDGLFFLRYHRDPFGGHRHCHQWPKKRFLLLRSGGPLAPLGGKGFWLSDPRPSIHAPLAPKAPKGQRLTRWDRKQRPKGTAPALVNRLHYIPFGGFSCPAPRPKPPMPPAWEQRIKGNRGFGALGLLEFGS